MDVPRQIPPRNGNFVDRHAVLAAVEEHAAGSVGNATVVIKGLPGVGKTAVVTELMHRLSEGYHGGQLFHRLSDATSIPDLLANSLVALGVRREDLPDLPEARHGHYLTLTRGRRMLVVLDGAATAAQVSWLEPADGGSLIVVTGRNSAADLSRGGRVFELDPLPGDEARELLGRIVGPERVAAEPEAAERILVLCANMPFALCVVGSLIAQHPARRIGSFADLLSSDRRRSTALSLPEIFDAAYTSLSETARECYRALGLRSHAGTLSSAALTAALNLPADEVDWCAIELANLHLITERDRGYEINDLVRVHARGLADGERDRREERLIDYYDRGLKAADTLLAPNRPWRNLLFPAVRFPGPGTGEFSDAEGAREWLRREHDNLVTAAEYALGAGRDALVARWSVLLWPFQEQDKRLDAMLAVNAHGITAAERSNLAEAASFLHTQAGFVHYWRRAAPQAVASFERGVQAARRLPPSRLAAQLEASALEGLGLAQLVGGSVEAARDTLRHNYELARGIGDGRRLALAAFHRAKVEEPSLALTLLADAHDFFAAAASPEPDNAAKILAWRGRKLLEQGGTVSVAEELLEAALSVMRRRRRRFDEAEILVALGDCALAAGDRATAVERYRAGHSIYSELAFRSIAAVVQEQIDVVSAE
ncbi:NB-ARC domain-containing protein [Nocardia wallacei]|uniref:NB-ARC domain-containing protein n=1 Tax=Nocardia wallacei TaxID=480035 RepID=UPI0024549B4C|nr:NB-ARC domain-containing protein [Nocardia wallacei]